MKVIILINLKGIKLKKTTAKSDRHNKSPNYLKDYHCQLSSHIDTERLNHFGNVIHSLLS